jgi:hypothetical protein
VRDGLGEYQKSEDAPKHQLLNRGNHLVGTQSITSNDDDDDETEVS